MASYIPNDTNLRGGRGSQASHVEHGTADCPLDAPSMLLLTGPNFSGKSVYMKQVSRSNGPKLPSAHHGKVALIVYLAHIGR